MAARIAVAALSGLLLIGLVVTASLGTTVAVAMVAVAGALVVGIHLGPTRAGLLALGAAIFFGPLSAIRPVAAVEFVTASDVFLLVAMALLLPTIVHHRFRLPPLFQLGAIALFVSGMLTSLVTANPIVSLRYLVQLLIATLVLPAFLAWLGPGRELLTRLGLAYVFGQSVSVVVALAEGSSPIGRADGLTTHPNFFGLTCVLAFSLTLFLIPRVDVPMQRLLLVLDLLFVIGVSNSGSRAALLALVMVAVTWVLVERSTMGGFVMVFIAGVGVALADFALNAISPGSAISRLAGDATAATSDQSRVGLLREGFDQFAARPILGNGFENALKAHNIFLEVAVAAGAIGLVGYAMMMSSLLRPLFDRDNKLHALCYPVLGYLLIGMLSNSLWDRFIWTALCLAALAMIGHDDTDADDTDAPEDADQPTPADAGRHAEAPSGGRATRPRSRP